jgi:flagellar hook-length control protein FliK
MAIKDESQNKFPRQEKIMNVSQTVHTPQKNAAGESSQAIPEITDSELFLSQLTRAQQGPEWFTETDVKTEKERANEVQQARRRESEDLEDDLVVGLTNQGYVNQSKQVDVLDLARVASASENRERLAQHAEKKHLHTPAVNKEGEVDTVESRFSKAINSELESGRKGAPGRNLVEYTANAETDESMPALKNSQIISEDTLNREVMLRPDANLARSMKPMVAGKPATRLSEKGLSELSKISATDAGGKDTSKTATAKVMSLTGLSETSPESRRANAGLKAESNTAKPETPVNIKDVVGNVKIMISSKTNEMVMKLAPEHLGKMEIRLKKEGGKLMGRFKVESRQAKEAMESQLPALKEGLAEQGVHVEEFVILVNDEETSNQSFAFNQGQDGEASQSHQSRLVEGDTSSGNRTAEQSTDSNQENASGLNIYA